MGRVGGPGLAEVQPEGRRLPGESWGLTIVRNRRWWQWRRLRRRRPREGESAGVLEGTHWGRGRDPVCLLGAGADFVGTPPAPKTKEDDAIETWSVSWSGVWKRAPTVKSGVARGGGYRFRRRKIAGMSMWNSCPMVWAACHPHTRNSGVPCWADACPMDDGTGKYGAGNPASARRVSVPSE